MAKNVQPYEKSSLSRKDIIINNFLGGISWALGATLGLAVVFTIISFIAKQVNVIPFVGSFVSQIVTYVLQNNPHTH